MSINWDILIKIAVPLGTLMLGRFLDRWFEKRPKLISYIGHVSMFSLNDEKRTQVYTHAIVISNTGRKTANNVRVGHNVLPTNYLLTPNVPHVKEEVPTGSKEIVIPKLVPGEQITISYLYFPPLTWGQINTYTKSDEGFAKILKVIPTPQPTKWVTRLRLILEFVGVIAIVYSIVEVVRWLLA
jgi:hypothetical protein